MSSCRQRSRSSSSSLTQDDSLRTSLKRAAYTPSWTSEKKRRSNKPVPFQRPSRQSSPGSERGPRPSSWFPSSPSAFGLPSGSSSVPSRGALDEPFPRVTPFDSDDSERRLCLKDVIRIRSKAFSELHQSVADNGQSLIHRMREYENLRSAQHRTPPKHRDSDKRGRKMFSIRRKSGHRAPSTPANDPEWGLIIGGASEAQERRHFGQRARSLDDMEVDGSGSDYSPLQRPSTSPSDNPWSFLLPPSFSPHDPVSNDTESAMGSPSPISLYCNPELSSPSATSSVVSLAIHTPDGSDLDVAGRPSDTDKAIASLNLALANGAGGLNDYSAVLEYHTTTDAECYDPGDLWH